MLSILIPVYNVEVVNFIKLLHAQCCKQEIVFEILAFDDCSPTLKIRGLNQEIASLPHVTYHELSQNIGRASIRNQLGNAAQYPYLLFLDADSWANPPFIQKYIQNLNPRTVLVGGTAYATTPPHRVEDGILHWTIGSAREVHSVEKRSQNPYHAFTSNNFLIPKSVFLKHSFDENIKEYGHEDTLLGLSLAQGQVPIKHIDNPLIHTGLEPPKVFLEKKRKALSNLIVLTEKYAWLDTTLLKAERLLQRFFLHRITVSIYSIFESHIEKNLKGKSPSIWLFFWYNMVWLDRLRKGL